MIYESEYWKDDLIKQAGLLRKRMTQKRWSAATHGRFEQLVMSGFYTIRKLSEAKLLADTTISQEIELIAYQPTGKVVTLINWHKLDQLYDLNSPIAAKRDVMFLCHQFVHSYIFMASFNDVPFGLEGVLFCSDRERHKFLYHMDISKMIALFEQAGSEYPNKVHMKYNEKSEIMMLSQEIHPEEEMFTVLEGEIEVTFRGAKSVLRAGETANIPANAPHEFHNVSGQSVRLLCLCSPAGQEKFFMAIGVPVATRTETLPKPDEARSFALQVLAARFHTIFNFGRSSNGFKSAEKLLITGGNSSI